MGRLSEKFKKLNKPLDANKLIEKRFGAKDYIYKPISVATFFAICIYATWVIWSSGFDFSEKIYMSCDSNEKCLNLWQLCNERDVDFMKYSLFHCEGLVGLECTDPLCNEAYLLPGQSIGKKPKNHSIDMLSIIGVGAILNHLLYMWRQTWRSRSK